jgi:hypothetical protein
MLLKALKHVRLSRNDSFCYYVLNFAHNCFIVNSLFLKGLSECSNSPLRALTIHVHAIILHEVDIPFVDAKISQMHVLLSLTVFFITFIFLRSIFTSCESSQTFVVNVQSQRVDARNGNVDSKIKFKSVEKKWVIDILADHVLLFLVRNVI